MRRQGARQVYAVIGHPVAHSLSPAMQNAAFDAAGIDAVYRAIDVPPERLEESLRALHAEGVAGLNVTLPHKEAVYRLLDDATPEARVAEAANTLRRVLGGWTGHATDGLGFLEWADALAVPLGGARVLLLGAGGAARSIAPALLERGVAALAVVSRTPARSQRLIAGLEARAPAGSRLVAAGIVDASGVGRRTRWDLLIRAIPDPEVGPAEAGWWSELTRGALVLDLNYGPRAAAVRARAAREGRRMEDGLELLLRQGALSFTYWTGVRAPMGAMRAAVANGGA